MLGVSRIEGYTDSGEEHYTGWDITRDARNQITGLEKIWDEWRDIEPDYLNVSYCYNDQGMRTRKSIDEAALPRESVYYYNGTQLIFEAQYQAGALLRVLGFQYDPQGSPLYLTLWNNPADAAQYTVYRYQYNLLGEIEKLLLVKSVNGTSVTYPNTEAASYTYSAFGKIMAQSGEMAAINPIRYKGYYYDAETGWYYLQSRYYSPEWGIFLTLDDPGILLASADEQLSMDLVAYCGNDPVNYVDVGGSSRILNSIKNFYRNYKDMVRWRTQQFSHMLLQYDIIMKRAMLDTMAKCYLGLMKGYWLSYYMFHHALFGNGSDAPDYIISFMKTVLTINEGFINDMILLTQNSTDKEIHEFIGKEFKSGDLYYSIATYSGYVDGYRNEDGIWNLYILLWDDYDFDDATRTLDYGISVGNIANDMGYWLQKYHLLIPYYFEVYFTLTI